MSIKTLSGDIAFYGVLDLLQRSVSIIMVPLYTRVLSQKEYGDLDIILVFVSFLFILVDLQFTAGFSRLYYERSAEGKSKRFVGTTLASRLVGSVVLLAVFFMLGFSGRLEFDFVPSFQSNTIAWVLAAISIPLTLSYDILLLQARMLRWKKWFALGSFSNVLLSCALSTLFAFVFKLGIVSVLWGMFIGKLVGLLFLAWGLRKEFTLCLDLKPFKNLLAYTWPLIPGFWLAHSSGYMNRFFVFAELGAEENAILSLCMKIVSLLAMFAIAFQSAWQPLAMSHIGSSSGNEFYVRSMRLFIAGSIFSMFFIAALLDTILSILAPDAYGVVRHYFPMFAVGMVLSTCATNIQLGHQIAKTTHWISISSLTTITINFSILILLTKSHGIFGAGFAWVVSFTASCLLMFYSAQKKYHIPYDLKAFATLGLGCVLMLVLGFMSYRQFIPDWLFSIFAVLMSVALPWFVIKDSELHALKLFLRQKFNS